MSKTKKLEREKIILTAVSGANANSSWLTSDRVEALTGGDCMLIATAPRCGVSPKVKFANEVHQPIDDLMRKAIQAAKTVAPTGRTQR